MSSWRDYTGNNNSNGDWRNYVYGAKEGAQKRIQFDKEVKDSIDKYQASQVKPADPKTDSYQEALSKSIGIQAPSTPKTVEDNGFWSKVRNLNLENTPVFKAITAPINKLYEIPFAQRLITTAGEAVAGPEAYKNNDGSVMRPMDTGSKVGNLAADVVGTGLGFGTKVPGLNTSFQGAASDAVKPLLSKLPQGTSKIADYGANALKSGLEFGALNTVQSLSQNKSLGESALSGLEGIGQGALFGTALKGAGDILKLPQTIKNTNKNILNDAFTQKFGELPPLESKLNNPKGILKSSIPSVELLNPQNNTNIPNANLKPIGSELKPINTPLKTIAADMEKGNSLNIPILDKGNLSKVYSNTLQKTDVLTQAEKDLLKPNDFTYDVKTEKASLEEAKNRIASNMQGEINKLNNKDLYSGSDVDTMMGILGNKYLKEAQSTGDYTQVSNWLKNVRKAGTEGGRIVQAFAKYSRTKEGALVEAQRTVDNVEEGLKKTNPKLINDINQETNNLKNGLDKAKSEAGTEVQKLLPEDMLASKVSSTFNESKIKEPNLINDMVNELFRVAKESPLPEKVASAKRSPLEFLSAAIQNKGQYTDVWGKAKDIVKAKYTDDPQALQILDDYFNKGIIPQYSNTTVGNSVKTSIKDLGSTLDNIAKSTKGNKEQFLTELTNHISKVTGATGQDASLLAGKIKENYDSLVTEKSQSILKQMFKDVPPKQQKSILGKVNELINLGAYDDSSLRDLIKQKKGLPILDGGDIKFITEHMDKASQFPEGSYENRMEMAKVGQLIAEKQPSTNMEKFQAVQRIGMLLNPKSTVVRNPLGNVLLNGMESIKNIPGAGIDKMVSSVRDSERTTLLNPMVKGKAAAEGFTTGISEWRKDIINGVDTSPVGGGVELPNKTKIFNENVSNPVQRTINKAANKIHFVVGKALKLGDTPFYNAAYSERIAELKAIKKTDIVTDEMKNDAATYGLERTLQNDSALSSLFTGLKQANFLNNHPGAKTIYQTFANLILPFAKTPANVLDKFIMYSPGGILKSTGHALATKGKGTFNQKKFVDDMARGLTGTGLATLGYLMAQKGLITGAKNSNNKVEGLENALGKQNYAFKIGDTYQTVDWALPAAAPLMMGADIYNSIKGSSDVGTALKDGTGSAVNLMFNSTLLQGPSKLAGGYNPAVSIGNALLGTTTQATPTIGKQFSQLVDPYVRETYDPNPLKQTLNKTIARIPFASKSLPIKQDTLGNDIKAFQGKNNIFNVMFNPGFSTTYKPTDTQKEIIRLYNDSGETSQIPGAAPKVIPKTKLNPQINLNGKDLSNYQKLIGENTLKAYNTIINSGSYQNKDDADKAKLLAAALEKAKKQATLEIVKEKGVSK